MAPIQWHRVKRGRCAGQPEGSRSMERGGRSAMGGNRKSNSKMAPRGGEGGEGQKRAEANIFLSGRKGEIAGRGIQKKKKERGHGGLCATELAMKPSPPCVFRMT